MKNLKKFICRMFPASVLIILNSFLSACVLSDSSTVNKTNLHDNSSSNVQLGLAYLQANDVSRAKEKLLLALRQAPRWAQANDAMGYFLERTGDKLKAEDYYQRALALAPHNGAALNNYGAFLCRDHRPNEAEKMFLKAVNDPDYLNIAQAYQNAGLCALTLPDKQKAHHYFQKALSAAGVNHL